MTQISSLLTGLFSGAMLLIALALVSFWKSLEPAEFQVWFAAHAFRVGRVMIPLGALSFIACAGAAWLGPAPVRRAQGVAVCALLGVVVTYLVFVDPINSRLGGDPVPGAEIARLLSRWEFWHWVRVGLGTVAFVATLRAGRAAHNA